VNYYKFVCNWQTERECFYRRLFGNGTKYVDETDTTLNVTAGDTLFLHRYTRTPDRYGYLYGPFTAASDAQKNIVEEAWGYVGRFPWQVRIEVEDTVFLRSVEALREQAEDPPADLAGYAQEFSEIEGLWLTGAVENGDAILEP